MLPALAVKTRIVGRVELVIVRAFVVAEFTLAWRQLVSAGLGGKGFAGFGCAV